VANIEGGVGDEDGGVLGVLGIVGLGGRPTPGTVESLEVAGVTIPGPPGRMELLEGGRMGIV